MYPQEEQVQKLIYEQMCQQYGLKPEWLGKQFQHEGETYTIAGLNIRSKRFPVVITGGKYIAMSTDFIVGAMTDDMAGAQARAMEKRRVEERTNWKLASAYGLKPEWLDKTFTFRNSPVTIIGLAPTRRRYPIAGKNAWGDINYYPLDTVLKSFMAAA
jgi:hypothetical protein